MLPLYAVRIEDLGGNLVKFDCVVCDHTALLSQNSLLRLGLDQHVEVLDLKDRVRCPGCGVRGRATDERLKMLPMLNRALIAAGKIIGQLMILSLVAGLFIAPVLAMLAASFYISLGLTHLIGAEGFVSFVMFWIFVGFLGWYVSPHVRPQISNAMSALLRSEEEDAALSWLKKFLETRTPGRETNAIPGKSIEAFGVLMERYPTAILDTSKLPLPKADMKCLFTRAWLTKTDEKVRDFLEIAYVHLSQFQDGVGDKPIDCTLPSDPDPAKTMAILEPYLWFSGAVTKEAESLRAEFEDFKRRKSP